MRDDRGRRTSIMPNMRAPRFLPVSSERRARLREASSARGSVGAVDISTSSAVRFDEDASLWAH